jgi:ABC-type transporter Mla subunit MlaD
VSAATDAVREALEEVENRQDEFVVALDTARQEIRDARDAIRAAVNVLIAAASSICRLYDDGEGSENAVVAAVTALGGPDSSERGPLDDLADAAETLDSAADTVTDALGDDDPTQQDCVEESHGSQDVAGGA